MSDKIRPFAVPEPCHQGWDTMRRDVGARHCASCDKHVVDIARLTPTELRGIVTLTRGRFCGHQTIRDGQLVLASEPALSERPRPPFALRVVVGVAAVASAFGVAACQPASAAAPDPIVVTQLDPEQRPTPVPEAPADAVRAGGDYEVDGDIAAPDDVSAHQIGFEKQSAKLGTAQSQQLIEVARAMTASPWIAAVVIEGHVYLDELTTKGPDLGMARARSVEAALVKLGVKADRLRVAAIRPTPKQPDHVLSRSVTFRICTSLDACK